MWDCRNKGRNHHKWTAADGDTDICRADVSIARGRRSLGEGHGQGVSLTRLPPSFILQAVRKAATICPRPLQVDLWPFDLESGVRVTCDVGYLCANFGLPGPLCSRLRPDVRDRQTDVRQHHRLMSLPIRAGHDKDVCTRQTRRCIYNACRAHHWDDAAAATVANSQVKYLPSHPVDISIKITT